MLKKSKPRLFNATSNVGHLVPGRFSPIFVSSKQLQYVSVATLSRFVARFARVGILNSRTGGSREVLVSVSESGFPFYSILLTVAL